MSWVGSPTAVRIKSIVTRPALGILAAPILARVAVILDENTATHHSITFTAVPTTSSTASWPPIEYNEEVLVWGRCLYEEELLKSSRVSPVKKKRGETMWEIGWMRGLSWGSDHPFKLSCPNVTTDVFIQIKELYTNASISACLKGHRHKSKDTKKQKKLGRNGLPGWRFK